MLPASKEYVLEAGSVMFVPNQVYHIANTGEFSLSIVMDYINPSRDFLEMELAKEVSTQNSFQNRKDTYLSPMNMDNPTITEQILDAKSIMEKFSSAFDKRVLKLKSNAGIRRKSVRDLKKQIPTGDFRIKGKEIFPICLFEPGNNEIMRVC